MAAMQSGEWPLTDSPFGGGSNLSGISVSQQFQTYFMYVPPGTNSIWVTLQSMNWSWSASAALTGGNWTVSSPTYTKNPSSSYSSPLPVWSNYERNIP